MKKERKLAFVLTVSLLAACGPGLNDDVVSLGGGYFYRREGAEHKYIYYQQSNERKDIYPKVVGYAYDSTFIIVAQMPMKGFGRAHLASLLNHGQANYDELLNKADSLIANDPYYVEIYSAPINYWIADKERDKLYGPYSLKKYQIKRKELNIPDELELEIKQ